MSMQEMLVNVVEPDRKGLYRVGGICALVFGIAYIIIIALYVPMGAPPSGAEARLSYMSENTTTWWSILGLSVLTDFLLVPIALSLYLALKGINRNAMLLAAAFTELFVILDLALTWTNYAVLIPLSVSYAATSIDAQKAAVVAAATYPTTVLESDLLFVYNTLTLSIGILLTGLVMRKGVFNKVTAYFGLATGFFGIVAVTGPFIFRALESVIILASALTTVWVLFVSFKLIRLGQQ
jgi:hypothetical protein